MQINSSQNPTALYGINQVSPQAQAEQRPARNPNPEQSDSALTVSISPEAQALQKVATVMAAANAEQDATKQVIQQQTEQQLQNQRPAAQSPRIDLTV